MNDYKLFTVTSNGITKTIQSYSSYDAAMEFTKSTPLDLGDLIEVDSGESVSVWVYSGSTNIFFYLNSKQSSKLSQVTR